MKTAELKYSRLTAQHLLVPTDAYVCVRDLCGVQAQFLSNSFHALRIRSIYERVFTGTHTKNIPQHITLFLFNRYGR